MVDHCDCVIRCGQTCRWVSSGIFVYEDYRFRVVQAIEKKGCSKSGNMSQIQLEPSDVETKAKFPVLAK